MEIKLNGSGKVRSEEIRKYCANIVAAVDECLRSVQALEGTIDTQALTERLLKLLSDANETAISGEKLALTLEKREQIAALYENIEVK